MKALVATIALLCVSSTVLAHDIYSNLRDRDGHLCCGGQDCKPVKVIVLPNGSYYLPASGETIPADMAAPSPDERFHNVSIIQWQMSMILSGENPHGKTNLRLDASLRQCTLRSSRCIGGQMPDRLQWLQDR
jgi:hypothetical protein